MYGNYHSPCVVSGFRRGRHCFAAGDVDGFGDWKEDSCIYGAGDC